MNPQLKLSDLLAPSHLGHTSKMVYEMFRLGNELIEAHKLGDFSMAEKILDKLDTKIKQLKIQVIALQKVSR